MSSSLGIAFDNTFVNKPSDFKECVLIKSSTDDNIDLALIQLKDKTTPQYVKFLFDSSDHNLNLKNDMLEKGEEFDVNKPIKINTKL